MSGKSTGLLLVIAAALFALIYFVEQPIRKAALIPPNRNVLPNLHPTNITAVEIRAGGGSIRAEQTNHSWQLRKPVSYPADAARIAALLQGLADWQWRTAIGPDELKNGRNAMAEFGFDPWQYSIQIEENGEERTLLIGQKSVLGDEVYLNVAGSYQIYVADADTLKWIPTNNDTWRDLTVLDLNRTPFQSIKIWTNSVGTPMDLRLDPDSRLWSMTEPLHARADTPKINALLAQLQGLRVSRFVPDNAPGELDQSGLLGGTQTPQLRLTFLRDTTAANVATEMQIGASPTNNPKLVYAIRGSPYPSNVIEIASDPLLPWESSYTNFLDRHLISESPATIASIEADGLDKFTVQKTTNGGWRVIGPDESFPGDASLMQQWLGAFTNIETDMEKKVEADVKVFGLDTPILRYRLRFAAAPGQTNQVPTELLFGVSTNQPGKVFEGRPRNEEVSVNAISPEQFERLPQASWELRDLGVWHFETNEVVAIHVHQLGAERQFIRDAQNQWVLAAGSPGAIISPAIDETLYRLGRLRAIYWSGEGTDPLDQFGFGPTDYRIAVVLKRGSQMETNTIQFGKESPHLHPYASVVKEGRRLIFEFPIDLFSNLVTEYLGIPPTSRSSP